MLADKASRYQPFGVMLDKAWLFAQGGRPVIYQSADEYEGLPPALHYRHVRYEPSNAIDKVVDFTWEREWRIPGDLVLPPEKVTVVVPSRQFVDYAKETYRASPNDSDELMRGFSSLDWHYLALEDLGMTFEV